jgi:hypothetical protein
MGQAGLSAAAVADQAGMAVIAGSNRTPAGAGFTQRVAAGVILDVARAKRAGDAGKAVRASGAGVAVGLRRNSVIGSEPSFNSGAVPFAS